jgi:hypothetical protein
MAKAAAQPAQDLPPTDTAEGRLLHAILTQDLSRFRAALAEKAEVNFDGGKPLAAAAVVDNQLMMKELIIRGADIAHAQNELKKQREAIPRKKSYDHWGDVSYSYKKGDRKRYTDLGTYIKRLGDYQKTFIKDVAPVESVQLQFRTLQEIQEMKAEMLTAIHGKPLAKQHLPAPAAFRAPTHKPEGM